MVEGRRWTYAWERNFVRIDSAPRAAHNLVMPTRPTRLARLIERVRRQHGRQEEPPPRTAFEHVLWEKVAYLAPDERRADTFALLGRAVGRTPEALLRASRSRVLEIFAAGGVEAASRVDNALDAARYVIGELNGSLDGACALPLSQAVKQLTRIRGIAAPGAERILLFTRSHAVLGLDSNGLRVLQRLGYGTPAKSYAAGYRSATAAALAELPRECEPLVQVHLLLRRHGQTVCKTSAPQCDLCTLKSDCPTAPLPAARSASRGRTSLAR